MSRCDPLTGDALERVRSFVHREARLLDERRYEDWLGVWSTTEDTLYWVPAEDEHVGGDEVISYVYDNLARLTTRVKQLLTGVRYSQVPMSNTVRLVSNLEAYADGRDAVRVLTSFALHEYRLGRTHVWAGRIVYGLVGLADGAPRIAMKKVVLVDRGGALPSMAFLL
jgi:3-phenylpropionate/cinnamic acid dioxygenase small subunit